MKQSEAVEFVYSLMRSVQKLRSNAALDLGSRPADYRVRESLDKWVFDDRYQLVPALGRVTSGLEAGRELEGMTFYNLMTIVHRFSPLLQAQGVIWGKEFPKPDPLWVVGWDAE